MNSCLLLFFVAPGPAPSPPPPSFMSKNSPGCKTWPTPH
jgi:hypothetical protein